MKKKVNEYIFYNDYIEGIASNDNSIKFIIDIDDYDKVKDICWYASISMDGNIYMNNKTKTYISLHRLILNAKKGEYVDHIDRNSLNNKKENLRIVTNQQNGFNSSIKKNNTSGFIGVTLSKDRNKWTSQIKINYKVINLGRFLKKEDAIKARLKAELKYFGKDFAPQRHLFEEYGIKENEICII